MKDEKDALGRVRESRRRISEKFGNDPRKLVEYYMELQEQFRDRLLSRVQPKNKHGKTA